MFGEVHSIWQKYFLVVIFQEGMFDYFTTKVANILPHATVDHLPVIIDLLWSSISPLLPLIDAGKCNLH